MPVSPESEIGIAYGQGRTAADALALPTTNPYSDATQLGGSQRAAWFQGYYDAIRDQNIRILQSGLAFLVTGLTPTFPLRAPNGSAAAPSYSFSAQPTAGMYIASDGRLQLRSATPTGVDVNGPALVIIPGQGTGAGAGGNLSLQVSVPGPASGGAPNAPQSCIVLYGNNGQVQITGPAVQVGPGNLTLGAASIAAGVTDGIGAAASNINGSVGTGTGVGGVVQINVAPAAAGSGSAPNALQPVFQANPASGDVVLNGALLASGVRGAINLGGLATGSNLKVDRTITAAGTTGAQTINKMAGTVNFAAAAPSLVVTNSQVNANSIVLCTVRTVDATMKSVAAVCGAGSFTLTPNAAPTGEVSVGFLVLN